MPDRATEPAATRAATALAGLAGLACVACWLLPALIAGSVVGACRRGGELAARSGRRLVTIAGALWWRQARRSS